MWVRLATLLVNPSIDAKPDNVRCVRGVKLPHDRRFEPHGLDQGNAHFACDSDERVPAHEKDQRLSLSWLKLGYSQFRF
jgi:hypothetical protein